MVGERRPASPLLLLLLHDHHGLVHHLCSRLSCPAAPEACCVDLSCSASPPLSTNAPPCPAPHRPQNTAKVDGKLRYPTATYRVSQKGGEEILVGCGIADCKNTFCSGTRGPFLQACRFQAVCCPPLSPRCQPLPTAAQTTTADNEVFIFGGHGDKDEDEDYGMQAFRSYNHGNGTLWSGAEMGSGRWYPSVLTLADGSVLVVGGVKESSQAGYVAEDREDTDNPTYTVYDPKSRWAGLVLCAVWW